MLTVKKQIKEGKDALLEIQRDQLADIAEAMIAQIISRLKRLTPSTKLEAVKDVATPGTNAYKSLLTTALVVISSEALQAARKEVPKARSVQLSDEWSIDDLPTKLRKKILSEVQLLVGTQISDLEKHLFFQFHSSVDSTDSLATIEDDLATAAEDYIRGPGIAAGAAVQAAKYVNTARQAFFYDEETLNEIEAFEFVNADPVSPICQDLAGTIFAKDDPNADRYQPPLHWNCKSWIRPILNGNLPKTKEIEALKPSKARLEDDIQFSEAGPFTCPTCG